MTLLLINRGNSENTLLRNSVWAVVHAHGIPSVEGILNQYNISLNRINGLVLQHWGAPPGTGSSISRSACTYEVVSLK